ncbi:MAG: response regulator [Bacteroidales bacterium]|jgi:CheY-like chemotaxis protein|nr:response regulator [Bacteroidales bacterium]
MESKSENSLTFLSKILVAEDELINRTLLLSICKAFEIECDIVSDGLQAYHKFTTNTYSALLLDIEMPVMNGLEALEKIRLYESEHGGHIPVIAVTSHSDKASREVYFKSGFDDYLSKPFKPFELAAILKKLKVIL